MNRIKLILTLIILFIALSILIIFINRPIIIHISNSSTLRNKEYKLGDTINPFKNFDFNNGEWEIYLFISSNDKNSISKDIPLGKCLVTTNKELMNEIKYNWNFIYTNADIATVESEIVFSQNGKEVFRSGIVLDSLNQGLQNRQYGWLEATPKDILSKYIKQFNRTYKPIIILR